MGVLTTQLRNRANLVRDLNIAELAKQKNFDKRSLLTGSWQVNYSDAEGEHKIGPTTANFIDTDTQKVLKQLGTRASAARHVEDEFLQDLIPKLKQTGAKPLWLAPTQNQTLKVVFWLYWSPCKRCADTLIGFFSNPNSYGKNNRPWVKLTYQERYYGWLTAKAAEDYYEYVRVKTNGQVVIKGQKLVELDDMDTD